MLFLSKKQNNQCYLNEKWTSNKCIFIATESIIINGINSICLRIIVKLFMGNLFILKICCTKNIARFFLVIRFTFF